MARPKKWEAMDNVVVIKVKSSKELKTLLKNKLKLEKSSMQKFFTEAMINKIKS